MFCFFLTALLAQLVLGAGQRTQLRVAFAYSTTTSDLGWTWRMNQGRIDMVGQLLDLYPGLAVQTFYVESLDDTASPPHCPSIFETWAKLKMDIVFGTSYGFQSCMAALAPDYPDTLWFPLLGDMNLTLPNWGLGVGNIHQVLFLAGMVAGRETKTGKVGACLPVPIPQTYGHLAAFAQGVAYANASVQIIAAWSNDWLSPQRDIFAVQRLTANNVDIIWHRCASFEGVDEAAALGVRSIGFNADFTLAAGESVLITPYYNWGPLFLWVARRVVEGTYTAALPVDLFPGMESDAVGLSTASYLVQKSTMAAVTDVAAAFRNGTNNTFCGPMLTNVGTVVGQAGSCLTLNQIRNLWWEPWNVVDRGHFALPDEVCHPGEQSHWDAEAEKYTCAACPAGTFSQAHINLTYQEYVCLPCPADKYSLSNATVCSACPSGHATNARQDGCIPIPMATAVMVGIVVGSVLGVVFLVVCAYAGWRMWRATADLRQLRRQFSNNNVAQECAEAFACFNLESVAWLRTCQNPNKIQQSFLQILEMMTMVRPYIPDHVLSLFTHREPSGPQDLPAGAAPATEGNALLRAGSDASDGMVRVRAASSDYVPRGSQSSDSAMSKSSRHGYRKSRSGHHTEARLLPSAGEWMPKRCTYMVVAVSFAAAGGGEEEDEGDRCLSATSQVLGEMVTIAKSFSATIDHVTCDKVALHWGLVNSVSEGALKATLASLEMAKVRGNLPVPWRDLLRLSVSVVQGVCNVASISAAGHSFFVVGGALPRQTRRLTSLALAAQCRCEVLVSAAVYQQVQYVVECMPRCFLGDDLFWQPVRQHASGTDHRDDEWMYELQQMEGDKPDKWCSRSLYGVFRAAAQGSTPGALRSHVNRLKEQFKSQMSVQDEACLELLLAGGERCRT